MKKSLVIIIAIVAVTLISFLAIRGRNRAISVKTVTTTPKSLIRSIAAKGELDSQAKAELKFLASGKIVWLSVTVGDTVSQGQALAALDKRDVESQLREAESNLIKARSELDRVGESRRQFNEAHRYDSPSAELFAQFGQYDAQVRSAVTSVDYYQYQIDQTQLALQNLNLTSPLSGIITKINLRAGEIYQTTSGPAVVVADLSPQNLYFKAEIDEADIAQIALGQAAEVTLDALAKEVFPGEITEMDSQTSLNASGDKIFIAKIAIGEELPESVRRLGLSGDAAITIEKRDEVLVFPLEAIVSEGDNKYVWRIKGERVNKVPIETGLETEFEAEVTQGLSSGDAVAITNLNLLKDGQKVRVEE